jgi:hypothetical protein
MDTPRKRQRPLQVVEGRLLKSVRLEHEWHDDIQDLETFRMPGFVMLTPRLYGPAPNNA